MRNFFLPYSEKLHRVNETPIDLMKEKPHCFAGEVGAVCGSMSGWPETETALS